MTPPGPVKGERIAAFALRTDAALGEANNRITACRDHYDNVRSEFGVNDGP